MLPCGTSPVPIGYGPSPRDRRAMEYVDPPEQSSRCLQWGCLGTWRLQCKRCSQVIVVWRRSRRRNITYGVRNESTRCSEARGGCAGRSGNMVVDEFELAFNGTSRAGDQRAVLFEGTLHAATRMHPRRSREVAGVHVRGDLLRSEDEASRRPRKAAGAQFAREPRSDDQTKTGGDQ